MEESIIAIMKDNEVAGIGLLVDEKKIITCAHVVNTSLGREQSHQRKPLTEGIVRIKFPFIDKVKSFRSYVDFWSPKPQDEKSNSIDIATLMIDEPVLFNVTATKFNLTENFVGRKVRFFGFPNYFSNGNWTAGTIEGKTTDGRYQVVGDANPFSPAVEARFSGTPAIDLKSNEVIGILQSKRLETGVKIYYVQPTINILDRNPNFSKCVVRNGIAHRIFNNILNESKEVLKHTLPGSFSGLTSAAIFFKLNKQIDSKSITPDQINSILSKVNDIKQSEENTENQFDIHEKSSTFENEYNINEEDQLEISSDELGDDGLLNSIFTLFN